MKQNHSKRQRAVRLLVGQRRGVATLDYVLVLCVVFPLAAFLLWAGPRMMSLVYDMIAVIISSPFS